MAKQQPPKQNAPASEEYRGLNSNSPAFPNFNEQGIFNPGMKKSEYALIQFVTAHIQAHGKHPEISELFGYASLGIYVLDSVTAEVTAVDDDRMKRGMLDDLGNTPY
jgi:hypothetical protein